MRLKITRSASLLLVDGLADDVVEDTSVLEVRKLGLRIETKDGLERLDGTSLNLIAIISVCIITLSKTERYLGQYKAQ